ncbi:MAG: transcription antitermination factor NusB [Anaerolineales bacterium]
MKKRTKARAIALQTLFELDITDHPLGTVLKNRIADSSLDEDLIYFIHDIVHGVWPNTSELDRFIAEHAPEWPLDQVAVIDRNILRIALWELAVNNNTPLKVVINEAVELAKTYGSDSASRFVNGVLGSLAERQNELRQSLQHLQIKTADEPK